MFKNIAVTLSANVTPYRVQMAHASRVTRDFGNDVNKATAKATPALRDVGRAALIVGGALAAGFGAAVAMAAQFDARMRNVNSIAKMSEAQFRSTSNAVLALSRTLPQSAATLADGLYDIVSSGFAGADALNILTASAIAATAGLTTTGTASKAIAAVLNAYGLAAGRAADVSDILFQTVNLGVLTFEELANNVGDWVGSASAAGVSAEMAAAGIATMTLSGIGASEAATSLNRTLQAFIKPSDAMLAQVKSLGYESALTMLQTRGLDGAMDDLRMSTGGSVEALVRIFPEIRAARGALALMANEGQNFSRVADGIVDPTARAGAAQAAYAEQSKSLTAQLALTRNRVSALAIEIGGKFLPPVIGAVRWVGNFSAAVTSLPGPIKMTVTAAAALTAALLLLGGAYTLVSARVQAVVAWHATLAAQAPRLAGALGLVGKAVSALLGPIGLVIAALGMFSMAFDKAHGQAQATIADATSGFDTGTLEGMRQQVEALREMAGAQDAARDSNRNLWGVIRGTGELLTPFKNKVLDTNIAAKDMAAATTEAEDRWGAMMRTIQRVGAATGLTTAEIEALATRTRVDLGDGTKETEQRLIGAAEAMRNGEEAAALLADQLGTAAMETGELEGETVKLTDAQQSLADGIRSFGGPADIYGKLVDDIGAKARETAEATAKATKSTKDSWEDYFREVNPNLGEFAHRLEESNRKVAAWQRDLVAIAGQGYSDVARIFAAMGQDAAPLVEQFVNTTDKATKDRLANALRENAKNGTDGMAVELEAGMKIAEEAGANGAQRTVDAIVKTLEGGESQVRAIARRYGIAFDEALNQAANIRYPGQAPGWTPPMAPGYKPPIRRAVGGAVPGAGSGDTVPAMLTPGEFVIRKQAAAALGMPLLTWLNAHAFAAGGLVPGMFPGGRQGDMSNVSPWDVTTRARGAGAVSDADWEKALRHRLATFRRWSDEWTEAYTSLVDLHEQQADREKQIADDVKTYLEAVYAERLSQEDNQYRAGRVSLDRYVALLKERHAREVQMHGYWSDEATAIRDRLVEIEKAGIEKQREHADVRFAIGQMSTADYIADLRKRLAETEQFSTEWQRLNEQITQVLKDEADKQADIVKRQQRVEDIRADIGEIGTDAYRAILVKRLATLERYSDDWYTVWQQIARIDDDAARRAQDAAEEMARAAEEAARAAADAAKAAAEEAARQREAIEAELRKWRDAAVDPIRETANFVAVFAGQLQVSGRAVLGYLEHQAEGARRWKAVVTDLMNSGVDSDLVDTLVQAGPKALGLANALKSVIASGDTSRLNALVDEIRAIGGNVGDLVIEKRGESIVERLGGTESMVWAQQFTAVLAPVTASVDAMNASLGITGQALTSTGSTLSFQTITTWPEWQQAAAAASLVTETRVEAMRTAFGRLWRQMADDHVMAHTLAASILAIPDRTITVTTVYRSVYETVGGPVKGRAVGGDVFGGQVYEVGENGREFFAPGMDGAIIPNHRLPASAGSSSRSVYIAPGAVQAPVTAPPGADLGEVARMVDERVGGALDKLVTRIESGMEES